MDDREALRAFVNRPWGELRLEKRAFAARRYRDQGAAASLRVARRLLARRRRLLPTHPTPEERRRDLEDHVRLKQLIDRAGRALAGY